FRGLCLCPGKLRFPTAKVALVESRFECWVSAPESQASRAALTIRQASLHRQISRFLTFQYAVDVIGLLLSSGKLNLSFRWLPEHSVLGVQAFPRLVFVLAFVSFPRRWPVSLQDVSS